MDEFVGLIMDELVGLIMDELVGLMWDPLMDALIAKCYLLLMGIGLGFLTDVNRKMSEAPH